MTNFDQNECSRMKLTVVKGNTTINVTSRFTKEKILIFSKVSLKSFVYDLIDVFSFPTEEVKMIYDQYSVIKCHLYLDLTNISSRSIVFNLICKKERNVKKSESRKTIFDILKQSLIAKRLFQISFSDLSDMFW